MRVRNIWRVIGLWLVLVVMAVNAAPHPAAAATDDGFNLTLSPLPISLTTTPGHPVTTPLQVQNTGTKPVKIHVSLLKFSAQGSLGQPNISDPQPQDAFIKWVKFSQTDFTAQPNVLNTITMTIQPPATAAFGYYYAVVFSQDNGKQPVVPKQNKINGAVASLVLVDVQAPGEKRRVEITAFKANHKVFQYLPASFTVQVRNTGNIHAVPTGNIFISRPGSKEFIGTLSVNKDQGNVLPKSNRQFTAEWDDGFPSYQLKRQNNQIVSDKSGTPIRELNWDLKNANKFRLGKYTASLTMIYNDGKRDVPMNAEVSFWVIPWIPFLIILVLLSLTFVGVYVMLRTIMRRLKRIRKRPV